MQSNRIRPLSANLRIFRFLDVVDLELNNTGLWWTGEDINAPGVAAAILRGYVDSNSPEAAYLLVADVTGDPTEPDIVNMTTERVAALDKTLESGIRDMCKPNGLEMARWMNTYANTYSGKETVLSAYIVIDPIVGEQQRMALRFMHNDRKLLVESAFQVSRAATLAKPMFKALHAVNFVERDL